MAATTFGADFKEQMLAAHNRYREQVNVPPLAWSESLAAQARRWAEMLARNGEFAHQRGDFGENLFEISGAPASAAEVVDAWASERFQYNHTTNSCRSRCGHYTQIVWRDTKSIGCGVASARGRQVWVCDYDPPGNIVGERPY